MEKRGTKVYISADMEGVTGSSGPTTCRWAAGTTTAGA